MKQFENIQIGTLVELAGGTTSQKLVTVEHKETGLFILIPIAVRWILRGFNSIATEAGSLAQVDVSAAMLISSLGNHVVGQVLQDNSNLHLTREQVQLCKGYLEESMHIEELLRDERDAAFDADGYIGMKHLLLDFKLWLMGEIVETPYVPQTTEVFNSSYATI